MWGVRPPHPACGWVRALSCVAFISGGLGLPCFYRFLNLSSVFLSGILLCGFIKHPKTRSFKTWLFSWCFVTLSTHAAFRR